LALIFCRTKSDGYFTCLPQGKAGGGRGRSRSQSDWSIVKEGDATGGPCSCDASRAINSSTKAGVYPWWTTTNTSQSLTVPGRGTAGGIIIIIIKDSKREIDILSVDQW